VNHCSWPLGEQTDTEINTHLSSAIERKATISQAGVLDTADGSKQNKSLMTIQDPLAVIIRLG
jgi:hypothetical protein